MLEKVVAQIVVPKPPVQGQGLTLAELGKLIAIVGSFLQSIGVLLAFIAIIVSGIMYMKAGANDKAIEKAKSWFKNALIGALIILAVGVIVNTIANIVTREFFCRFSVFGQCIIQ